MDPQPSSGGAVRRVRPLTGPIDAVVAVPGSKSIANRALVCAALADGTSEIANLPPGDDTMAMLRCLGGLGVEATVAGTTATVHGTNGEVSGAVSTLDAGLAGTTSRFVTAVAALAAQPITIDGLPSLRTRPFGPLHDALAQLGVAVTPGAGPGHLPVTVHGPPTGNTVTIRGDVSSQFVTALMLIGPYLPGGLRIELTTPLVSRPYVEMTAAVMAWFGIDPVVGVSASEERITVAPGSYTACDVSIEPDASSASYPLALAAAVGGAVEVPGLGVRSLQGDARFAGLLEAMGCEVVDTGAGMWVGRPEGATLVGLDVDMSEISDLVPTIAVVAAFASSPTWIRGVGFIRDKESDRLGDLARQLAKAGVDVEETDDGLVVRPSTPHGARLATHHDHRLAMAFGVLGSALAGDAALASGLTAIEVENPEVVTKSWPGYWEMLDAVGSAVGPAE